MGKANKWLVAAVAAVLLLSGAGVVNARRGYYDRNVKVLHMAGKVICQDCTQGWNEWLNGKPIKGAKVAVTCLDSRRRAVSHTTDATDDKGEFDLVVSKFVYGKAIRAEDCTVRLVSSPDATCNVMTDFGGGKCGVKPRHLAVVQGDLLKYAVGPFFFTSPACELPKTPYHGDEEEDEY